MIRTNTVLPLFSLSAIYCILLILFSGCASVKGPATFKPALPSLPEYSISDGSIIFSSRDVKIKILSLNPAETRNRLAAKDANNPLAEILGTTQYLAFLMDIQNFSGEKILYNPALTTLFDNSMGVHKPLDYTELYSLARNLPNPELVLNNMKDMFYDLTLTLKPGQNASRLLIFMASEEGESKLEILIKELYIGTRAITVSFGFEAE